jgi:predicted amidophosphoribosyltransferase
MKKKLLKLKDKKMCKKCGYEMEKDASFCPKCGKEQQTRGISFRFVNYSS